MEIRLRLVGDLFCTVGEFLGGTYETQGEIDEETSDPKVDDDTEQKRQYFDHFQFVLPCTCEEGTVFGAIQPTIQSSVTRRQGAGLETEQTVVSPSRIDFAGDQRIS